MKKIFIIAAILVVTLGGWWWWSAQQDDSPSDQLRLLGNVDIRQVSLAFDGSGRITEMAAEEGDRVSAGQIIGQLDTGTLALQAQQARAELDAQQQVLLALQHGSRPEEILQARALLASAEASAALAELEFDRNARLKASGSGAVSTRTVDEARAARDAATAKVEEVRAALQLAEAGARPEDIAAAAARVAAAQASLAVLDHQIQQGTLRAPVGAVVRSRLLEPGDQASPARPAYALAMTEPKWIRLYVSETDLGRIRPGMAAQVRSDAAPDQPVPGRIGYISSVAEFTPKYVQTEELRSSLVYEIRVIVDDAADALRLGQPVTVTIDLRSAS